MSIQVQPRADYSILSDYSEANALENFKTLKIVLYLRTCMSVHFQCWIHAKVRVAYTDRSRLKWSLVLKINRSVAVNVQLVYFCRPLNALKQQTQVGGWMGILPLIVFLALNSL